MVWGLQSTMFSPQSCPLRENTFVQRHTDSVHLVDGTIEMSFEISMRPEGLAYMARSTVFRMELYGLEVMHIISKRKSILGVTPKKGWK